MDIDYPMRVPPMPACLCVLCGLPAAGKSTLAETINRLAAEQGWNSTVVPYDDMIPEDAFHVKVLEDNNRLQQAQTEWKLRRREVLHCIEQFLKKPQCLTDPPSTSLLNLEAWRKYICTPLESKTDHLPLLILLDDNFYYPSMRYEVYQIAKKYSLGFCQVFLHCPEESCVSRNRRRSKPLPPEVILEMAKRLESPNPQKNSWERNSITLNSTNSFSKEDIQRLMELISTAMSNPLSPVEDSREQKEVDRLKCASNVVHQADQACRRLVSEAMKAAREKKLSAEHMRFLASELNESKTRLLHNLRKQFLQQLHINPGEEVVEHVVKMAVKDFDKDKEDILVKMLMNNSDSNCQSAMYS